MQRGSAKTLANPLTGAEAAGFEPANRFRAVNCFRGSLLQPLGHASCYFIGTLSQTLTLRAAFASSTYLLSQIPGPGRSSDDDLFNSPDPLFKGAIRACGLSIAAGLSLLASSGPASDDALLFYWDPVPNYLNSPIPLFKGAIRAYGLSIAAGPSLLANSGPASDDALVP